MKAPSTKEVNNQNNKNPRAYGFEGGEEQNQNQNPNGKRPWKGKEGGGKGKDKGGKGKVWEVTGAA
eukprot:5238432-Amphidinium_carterae.1